MHATIDRFPGLSRKYIQQTGKGPASCRRVPDEKAVAPRCRRVGRQAADGKAKDGSPR
ncbi:protein of unknown function [Methylacidimicrobium sp. AP8]|nr:protein of unknown function [Methylacidimicrobium sp. AP8]